MDVHNNYQTYSYSYNVLYQTVFHYDVSSIKIDIILFFFKRFLQNISVNLLSVTSFSVTFIKIIKRKTTLM